MPENEVDNRPTSQIDAERVLAEQRGERAPTSGVARSFAVEGNDVSNYVGVSPEYQTYASETEAPLPADEGIERAMEERGRKALSVDIPEGAKVDGPRPVDRVEEVDRPLAERVEPKQAAFNIPAAVTGDDGVLGSEPPVEQKQGEDAPKSETETKQRGGRQAKE